MDKHVNRGPSLLKSTSLPPPHPLFLDYMVAHFTFRAYGVNQVFRFVEGIWLHRKSRQINFFFRKDLLYFIRAQNVLSYRLI